MAAKRESDLINPGMAQPALDVSENLSADANLHPQVAQATETLDEAVARIRKIRVPFNGAMSQKLALPQRPGYHRHWFNDVAGRIDEASASGWAHVINPRDGNPTQRVVGSGRDGKALTAYAMELPEVFWQEEMDARHQVASSRIDEIKKRPFQAKPGQAQAADQGKFYSPSESGPLQVVKN